MRCVPALLTVSSVQAAPSSERPAVTQSVLPSGGATYPSSETDIFRTSEAMRCFLFRDGRPVLLESILGTQTQGNSETNRVPDQGPQVFLPDKLTGVILYTCGQKKAFGKAGHFCGRAAIALDEAGHEYEIRTVK